MNSRTIQAIVVTVALPDEHDLWRLDTSDIANPHASDKEVALARRDALMAEVAADARREKAA